jgi:cytochrome c oxidase cbb3-type subunit 4
MSVASLLSGVITAVLFACFVGGWLWAWSGKRRQAFEAAARLPLEDDATEVSR